MKDQKSIKTLGELKKSGYQSKSVKTEMRDNLVKSIKENKPVFTGVLGYESTVIPQLERAILSGHSINFLGLRGQAKTRMARMMVNLLDEYMPIIEGSEINDDPLQPLSYYGRNMVKKHGDDTPIDWVHRSERYAEKLATPDVNIADLIGDIDPIKAANLKLSYSDEGVLHFGIIPRAHRGIFVINELPDLQPRIQVALFNILQEGDIQIRGFKLRFPLDIQFVFTANPEDYTNRGAIITPLKDRIQSQIFTHYPKALSVARSITEQEVQLTEFQRNNIRVPEIIALLIEQIAVEARSSEYVDEKSGVSARLPISAYESVVASVERRMLLNGEETGVARVSDLSAAIPAIVGKIEMVYEGEQEGAVNVAHLLISSAIRTLSIEYFPLIENTQKKTGSGDTRNLIMPVIQWFEAGNDAELLLDGSEKSYRNTLAQIDGLAKIIKANKPEEDDFAVMSEFLLHAMAEYSLLDKKLLDDNFTFQDYFSSVLPKDIQ